MAIKSIAEELGIPEAKVKKVKDYALRKMREMLENIMIFALPDDKTFGS